METEAVETNETVVKKVRFGFGRKEWLLTFLFAFIFIFSGIATYVFSVHHPEWTQTNFDKIKDMIMGNESQNDNAITQLSQKHPNPDVWKLQLKETGKILLNNVRVTVIVLIGGMITIYFYPTVAMVGNGAILGLVLGATELADPESHPLTVFIRSILPHGTFELPAIFLACVIGSRWGKGFYHMIFRKKEEYSYKEVTFQILRFFGFILVPMLVIAAFIEMFVTPYLMLR